MASVPRDRRCTQCWRAYVRVLLLATKGGKAVDKRCDECADVTGLVILSDKRVAA